MAAGATGGARVTAAPLAAGRSVGRLFAVALVLLFLAIPAKAAAPDAFIAGIADLPVMPGMQEVAEAGVVFDKPSGRIVEAYAEGDVAQSAVLDFYGTTLPQLGWTQNADGSFRREGERLIIKVREDNDLALVRFMLLPQ